MMTMSELASDPFGPAATRTRDELDIGAKSGDENIVDGTEKLHDPYSVF
jgi:hypothetical protein